MWVAWTTASNRGAAVGRSFGDPAAIGLDFAFSLFINVCGFWKGRASVLGASAVAAAVAKLHVPGAWYIVIGGLVGVAVAAMLHNKESS
jgi:predicted branched-subunit amino acid permease